MTIAYGDVPLIDPVTGRFPDAFAPPSVAAAATAAQTAQGLAEDARDQAVALVGDANLDAAVADYLTLNPPTAGDDGREVEFQTTATHVQWRYVGDAAWTDLVPLASITGGDGLSVELQTTATHIQWRLVGGTWADLIALSALVGPAGPHNTLAIGTVTTGAPGSAADASVTGTAPEQVLNLTIPAGAPGAAGAGGGVTTALYLPGAAGNFVSCPDSAGTSITGDIDIRVRFAPQSLGVAYMLASKSGSSDANKSWQLSVNASGMPSLSYSQDGRFGANRTGTVALGMTAGVFVWMRCTVDIDNGAGGTTIAFYSSADGSSWTTLSSHNVTAITGLFDSTAPIELGTMWGGSSTNALAGYIQRFELRDGINGTVAASWDGRAPAASYRDPQGNIWAVNGTANAWSIV